MAHAVKGKLTAVSTHSRVEAAATFNNPTAEHEGLVSTHSRAKAAASTANKILYSFDVSTHSRTKAAALTALLDSSL